MFACTPNNPSGAPLAPEEIRALAQGVPDDVLLVLDEAYYEFDAAEGGVGALGELARRRGPWLSTRTLSKAYASQSTRIETQQTLNDLKAFLGWICPRIHVGFYSLKAIRR